MGFKLLNRYYDLLFPANLTVVDKLSELFKEGSALLDAGCGTGSYALLLAQKGFKVTGIDINPDFINIAKEKAKDKSEVDFLTQDLTSFSLNQSFSGIYSIGNTLPLLGRNGILKALANFYLHLTPGGLLVGQIVNFKLFFATGTFPFPEKKLNQDHLIFRRRYEPYEDKVRFSIELVFSEKGEIYTDVMLLYPLSMEELARLLKDAGFKHISFYRDFSFAPYDPEGRDLVFTAQK